MEKAIGVGLNAYETELNEKIGLLIKLLKNYDDGRRKGFFCLAVNLFDLHDLKTIMEQLDNASATDASQKSKAANAAFLFEELADEKGISLKLRKAT